VLKPTESADPEYLATSGCRCGVVLFLGGFLDDFFDLLVGRGAQRHATRQSASWYARHQLKDTEEHLRTDSEVGSEAAIGNLN